MRPFCFCSAALVMLSHPSVPLSAFIGLFPPGLGCQGSVGEHSGCDRGRQCWEAFLCWAFLLLLSDLSFAIWLICLKISCFILSQCCLGGSEGVDVHQEDGTDGFGKSSACRVGSQEQPLCLSGCTFTVIGIISLSLWAGWGDRGHCRVTPVTWPCQGLLLAAV